MKRYPFFTVIPQLQEEYGITISEDTAENLGMVGYRKIGNSNVRLKVVRAFPQKDCEGSWSVKLPCDHFKTEAVTLDFERGREVDAVDDFLGSKTYEIENWIEHFKRNKSAFYLPGTFVKYTEVGDTLYFTEPYDSVNILYKAEILDEDGLPLLSDDELEAVVAYLAYAVDLKKARVQKDQSQLAFAQLELTQFKQLCSKARVTDMSQNQWNEVLDVLHSMNVHSFGVSSTKPMH